MTHALQDWLCVNPDENPVLLIEPPIVKLSRRQKCLARISPIPSRFSELLFEKFQVPSLLMYKDAALTSFSRGRTVAMVVDIGEHFTRCCGVIDGFVDRENVVMQRFGAHRIRSLALQKCIFPAIGDYEMKLPGCVGMARFFLMGCSRLCRKTAKRVCSIRSLAVCAKKCAFFWNSCNRGAPCPKIPISLRSTFRWFLRFPQILRFPRLQGRNRIRLPLLCLMATLC